MALGYTVFSSYLLESYSGYSTAVHCNYINSLFLDTAYPEMQEVSISFTNPNDFKFLSNDINAGTGFTANKIYALIQVVDNSNFNSVSEAKPTASGWTKYDITNQITGYVAGSLLTATGLTNQVFKIPLQHYYDDPATVFTAYNLHDYIQYPTKETSDDNDLCFGDELFFMGNVSTQIKAVAYTTDLSINLPLNEFNSSTNATWNQDRVSITEIGIYDANKNLVAIGKLNNPIEKDSTIARTIVFSLDF